MFKVKAEIQLDVMLIKGNYTLSSFFSTAKGPFTVAVKNVAAKGNASVAVERDGKIRTQEISMDMTFSDMTMDFQNLGETRLKLLMTLSNRIQHSMQDSWAAYSKVSLTMHRIWCSIQ